MIFYIKKLFYISIVLGIIVIRDRGEVGGGKIMTDHIFDILGIGSREDSYTNLIVYAFKENFEFRRNFLLLLGEEDYGDWDFLIRYPILVVSGSGRKKDIPDLILISRKGNKVLLIENKIFSGEGWNQTDRYASDEFRKGLEACIRITGPDFRYFFLTLDGGSPSSTLFRTISYKDILRCIPQDLSGSKVDILLKELRERLDEYYNWSLPGEGDNVLVYLKSTRRLVDSYRTFRIVVDSFFDLGYDFLKEYYITANRGSCYIPLCLWYKKRWRGGTYPEEKEGERCYDIHFEFQWDTREDRENLTLYLHYHTNPYMTQEDIKRLRDDFVEGYKRMRDEFFNYIYIEAPRYWKINRTYLRIAYYTFDSDIRFSELKRILGELIGNMTPIIDEYLRMKGV